MSFFDVQIGFMPDNYLQYVRQTSALVEVQRVVEALRQPIAHHRDLRGVPLLEERQDPQFVVNLAANLVHVVARKVHVALAEVLPAAGHILFLRGAALRTITKIYLIILYIERSNPYNSHTMVGFFRPQIHTSYCSLA